MLPADTAGFADFGSTTPFADLYTVRALPAVMDTYGHQPRVLLWERPRQRRGADALAVDPRGDRPRRG